MIVETKMLSGAIWFKAIVTRADGRMNSETFKHKINAEAFVASFESK